MPQPLKNKIAYAFIGLIVLAVIGFGLFEWLSRGTSPLGGPCQTLGDCDSSATNCLKPKGRNMGICTHPCRRDKDCGPGLRCRAKSDVDFRIHPRKNRSTKEDNQKKYCFRKGSGKEKEEKK